MSKVYFFSARTKTHLQSIAKVKGPLGLKKIGFEDEAKDGEKICIKTHFGALENTRYLRPNYIRFLCDYVKEHGGNPIVAESCGWGAPEEFTGIHTEYSGRTTEKEYLDVALQHGFTSETMGAPLIMLDGEVGTDYELQKIKGKRFNEVLVAGRLREFDKVIMATHFKGHPGSGFGGAIKNLGIGCVSKGGKVQAHNGKTFKFDYDAPISNYKDCLKICPTDALSEGDDGKIKRDEAKCKYCYMCASVCEKEIIDIGQSTKEEFITQMVDNALGVIQYFGKDKVFYLNYVIDVTYQCDCSGGTDIPFVPDIGVLASRDPVALDQACIDLVHMSPMIPHSVVDQMENLPHDEGCEWFSYIPRFDPETGKYDFNEKGIPKREWEIQLKVGEELGLGSRDYELIEVTIDPEGNEK